ncbi:MAG: 23S rRNA (adenine(2503)-C(2))-methyltransferase RlmN [Sedimentisphaerales bacterium]|nr:23S rRNA (adenine(2503)-C(2))-methyltransferase RlmN [Sedimentisphaerales bacterium]
MEKDLKNKTIVELEDIAVAYEQKKFIARNMFSFIHQHNANDIDQFTTLSKQFRAFLKRDGYHLSQLKTVEVFADPDGTKKYLFELGDGTRIETVELLDEGRRTLCISTQVGCRMNCQFCATARLRFTRNLTAAEIVDQVIQVEKASGKINNIVYMGMGEPFDNYDETIKSVRMLNSSAGKNIGIRHITISTAGVIPGIEQLAEEGMQVRLAISLHAVRDHVREKIMRITKKYPLKPLLEAIMDYQRKTKRRVTFEYVMINGLNDSVADARALTKQLAPIKANINLIEYNPHEGCDFAPSSKKTIKAFQRILADADYEVVIRFKRGQHIKAACGQLGATWLKPNE